MHRNACFAVDVINVIAYGVIAVIGLFRICCGGDALVDQCSDFQFAVGQYEFAKLTEDLPIFLVSLRKFSSTQPCAAVCAVVDLRQRDLAIAGPRQAG